MGRREKEGGSVFSIIRRLTRQGHDACESGQALVEYALILTVVAFITVTALQTIGGSVSQFIFDAAAGVAGG
jgi:Flp pilus assembly pilin Flp